MTEPLIYTKNGNVPIDSVQLHVEWGFGPQFVKVREFYTDKATGEIVKDGAHVYSTQGIAGEGVAATL